MLTAPQIRDHTDAIQDQGVADCASIPESDLFDLLETDRKGLSQHEAERRLRLFGQNRMPRARPIAWYRKFLAGFTHFFAILLWIGAVLAWIGGTPNLSVAIVVVIVVNGVFSYWQEYQAERAADALQALLPNQVTVRRDGEILTVDAREIVRGDILVLSEGETIPADGRLFDVQALKLDLSSLTGESRPVPRTTIAPVASGQPLVFTPNLVFAGTSIASGRGEAVVTAIGADTEFGRIASLTQEQTKSPSPLMQELSHVTRVVSLLAFLLGAVFFVLGVIVGGLSFEMAFIFGIGIIVANVPEGLLPTLTLSLAYGVRKLAKKNALVKKLSAIESLGATTVILTDKTGTLTENQMTVREIWIDGQTVAIGDGTEIDRSAGAIELMRTAALCCDAHLRPKSDGSGWSAIGDPTEASILFAARKFGITDESLSYFERIAELPFDSARKRMTTVERIEGRNVACVKGALIEMLDRCSSIRRGNDDAPLSSSGRDSIRRTHRELARRGRRLLAVAQRTLADEIPTINGEWKTSDVERQLTFLGLIAMEDPPRPEVPGAIADCAAAGIRVLIVTGDDGLTAAAIGREIGLHKTPPTVITGKQLDQMDEISLTRIMSRRDVLFARVAPEHKLRLVETCRQLGEVVAVTGDGVNDAPALRRADIGVAMGITGTDVAREAADMILADDNFASIVDAVREGRTVYRNIRRFIGYVFVSNAAEMLPFIAFFLFGLPLPLTIMQVLAVDVGTDLLPALALGAEQTPEDIMFKPPRKRSESILDVPTLLRAYLWLGSIEGGLAMLGFLYALSAAGWFGDTFVSEGQAYVVATTVTFAGIVMAQIGNAFAWRTDKMSVFQVGLASNRLLLAGIGAELAILLILLYVPPFTEFFGMSPPSLAHWRILVLFGPILFLLEELRKLISRRS